MSRNIITKREITTKDAKTDHPEDPYVSKLIKLIPADIVGVYLAVFNLLDIGGQGNSGNKSIELIVFSLILIITPFYLKRVAGITTARQIIFCTVSFVIWVFSLGGPVEGLVIGGYSTKFLASVFLPIYTLLIPLIYEPKS